MQIPLIISSLAVLGLLLFSLARNQTANLTIAPTSTPVTTGTPVLTQTYTHSKYPLSFNYPAGWTVTETAINRASENLSIKSPSGFTLTASYASGGTRGRCDNNQETDMGQTQFSYNNRTFTVFFTGNRAAGTITTAYILPDTARCDNSPLVTVPRLGSIPAGVVKLEMKYPAAVPESQFKGPDFNAALQILQSARLD